MRFIRNHRFADDADVGSAPRVDRSLALIAAACSDRKDDDEAVGGGDETAPSSAPAATDAAGHHDRRTPSGTEPETADQAGDGRRPRPRRRPTPAVEPVIGGTLVVSGEAEVANPWTPAAMQCDSYCQQRRRARSSTRSSAYGADLEVHPFLAESVEPNADFTEWTVTLREGIAFHDGTPAQRRRRDLQPPARPAPACSIVRLRSPTSPRSPMPGPIRT